MYYFKAKVLILKHQKKTFLSSQSIKFLKLPIQNLTLEALKEKENKKHNFLKIETKSKNK